MTDEAFERVNALLHGIGGKAPRRLVWTVTLA
jgi:hypothetical protein